VKKFLTDVSDRHVARAVHSKIDQKVMLEWEASTKAGSIYAASS
jgi:hypothetical protein